jgi:exonuclease VII small subunit
MTLEQKLLRLQEIQQLIDQKKVTLSEVVPLLEEAYKLKSEIEKELKDMEIKLIQLSAQAEESGDGTL